MNKLLNDITTGKDNQTHEISRVFIVAVMGVVVFVSTIGTLMEVWHAFKTGQFDLQSYFQAYAVFIPSIGAFLLSGAGAIKLKQTNEPNGANAPPQTGTP